MLQNVILNEIDLDTPVLMVDEFQDLTAQMYKLFKMWSVKREAVIIAGDPFQSIYGFWGGSPDYFNNWNAPELVLNETHRLPEQIKQLGRKVLKLGRMNPPDPKAKAGYARPIITLRYGSVLPTYATELHLIRCNFQANALAMELAQAGKVFGGIERVSWTPDEITLANAIIAYRNGRLISLDAAKSIISAYPAKLFGPQATTEEILKLFEKHYKPDRTGLGLIKPIILDSMLSDDPTAKMIRSSKLFTAKIQGILSRKSSIMSWEVSNRKILTVHGSKGLEADAVFLHTAITPNIRKLTNLSSEDYAAESRVWYVGVTRAREVLYLIKDAGKSWQFPEVPA